MSYQPSAASLPASGRAIEGRKAAIKEAFKMRANGASRDAVIAHLVRNGRTTEVAEAIIDHHDRTAARQQEERRRPSRGPSPQELLRGSPIIEALAKAGGDSTLAFLVPPPGNTPGASNPSGSTCGQLAHADAPVGAEPSDPTGCRVA